MKITIILAVAVLGLGIAVGASSAQVASGGASAGGPAADAGAEAATPQAGRAGRVGRGRAGAARGGRAGRGRGGRGAATTPADPASPATTVPVNRGAGIDKREANQQRRIEQGIKKGQLTPDEVTKLQGLETNITAEEAAFKSDGKLTKDEAKQLKQSLNDASLQIWAERHDTEGNQKPVSRLGKDIFATDALTAKLESPDLTGADAKSFLADFHQMATLKRRLSSDSLTADERTKIQAEYNDLLNKYFITK